MTIDQIIGMIEDDLGFFKSLPDTTRADSEGPVAQELKNIYDDLSELRFDVAEGII